MHQSETTILLSHNQSISANHYKSIHRLKYMVDDINVDQVRQIFLIHHLKGLSVDNLSNICQLLDAEIIDEVNDFKRLSTYCIVLPRPELAYIWASNISELLSMDLFKGVVRVEVAWMYVLSHKSQRLLSVQQLSQATFLRNPAWQILLTKLSDLENYQSYQIHSLHSKNAPFEKTELCQDVIDIDNADLLQPSEILKKIVKEKILHKLPKHTVEHLNVPLSKLEVLTLLSFGHLDYSLAKQTLPLSNKTESIEQLFEINKDIRHDLLHGSVIISDSKPAHLALINPRTRHYIDFYQDDNYCCVVLSHNHLLKVCAYLAGERAALKGTRTITAMHTGAISHALSVGITMEPFDSVKQFHWLDDVVSGLASSSNRLGKPMISGYLRVLFQPKTTQGNKSIQNQLLATDLGSLYSNIYQHGRLRPGVRLVYFGCPVLHTGLGLNPWVDDDGSREGKQLFPYTKPESLLRFERLVHACLALGEDNPILDIEMIAEGGLAGAVRQVAQKSGNGVEVEIRHVPVSGQFMSAHDIWLSESGGRFLVLVEDIHIPLLFDYAGRERCDFAVIGQITTEPYIRVNDEDLGRDIVNLNVAECSNLVHNHTLQTSKPITFKGKLKGLNSRNFPSMIKKLLHLPSISDKTSLLSIQDRYATGLVTRDAFVGHYQIPIADVGVVQSHVLDHVGEAVAFGERPAVAWLDVQRSLHLSVAEALTNVVAAFCGDITHVNLSVSIAVRSDDIKGYHDAYHAVAILRQQWKKFWGIDITLGAFDILDSNHMNPVNFVVTATSRVLDVRKTLTPVGKIGDDYQLLAIDLSNGKNGLAASACAEVQGVLGDQCAAVDLSLIPVFFNLIQTLNQNNQIVAYHDRSDGGFFITLLEMAIAQQAGLDIYTDGLGDQPLESLLYEGPGAVIQIKKAEFTAIMSQFKAVGLESFIWPIGQVVKHHEITFSYRKKVIYSELLSVLHEHWSVFSQRLQFYHANKDEPGQVLQDIVYEKNLRLSEKINFEYPRDCCVDITPDSPKVAILREQGSTSHLPYAMACRQAGFLVNDVTTRDIEYGHETLRAYDGLIVVSGFSFDDFPVPGRSWAEVLLKKHPYILQEFVDFFNRQDTFTLGVGNGCHVLYHLREIIPGTSHWQPWVENSSLEFECRYVNVKIEPSSSPLFNEMAGSQLVVSVANQYGKVGLFDNSDNQLAVVMRYVDSNGKTTEQYPHNPFGASMGICSYTCDSGKVTLMMAHIERSTFVSQQTWRVDISDDLCSPWVKVFVNARQWVEARHKERPPLS